MAYTPVVPLSGPAGWAFLNRTLERQTAAFSASSDIARETAYFRERIGTVETATDLVSDRRLLRVALGAFGLEADIGSRAIIRKVLEDGTLDPKALANRLSDKRYLDLSKTFGFGDYAIPRTKVSDFADKLLLRYRTTQFDSAVGTVNPDMRLALNARRELSALASGGRSDMAMWFTVLGTPPLRKVFETAFGLPASFGAIDIDRQVEVLRKRTRALTGNDTVRQFADPDRVETLVRTFLVRSDIGSGASSGAGSVALALLSGIG